MPKKIASKKTAATASKKTASPKKAPVVELNNAPVLTPSGKLNKGGKVRMMHDNTLFDLTFAQFSKLVSAALKKVEPQVTNNRYIINVTYSAGGKMQKVQVTALYFHGIVLGRPMLKVSKHGGAVHPSVNPKQVIAKVSKHFAPLGWAFASMVE